jgi:sugar phosphate isomerase/epimerase
MVNEENIETVQRCLQQAGLSCSVVTPSMSSERRWQRGALTNADPTLRREAVDRVKNAMLLARTLGAYRINLWPGLDGYDYALQADYRRLYDLLVASIAECADSFPDVQICVEYKFKEPRTRVALATVGKVMAVLHRVNRPNVGGTLDVGHAFMALENPAESAVLLHQQGWLNHLHLNDTPGDWDWDMITGTAHLIEFIELFFWLRALGYDGWYSFDQYPRQEDPVLALQSSIHLLSDLYETMLNLDCKAMLSALNRQAYEEILPELRRALFGHNRGL